MKDYRGDINTLRAFAIIAVVDFHFRMGLFSGGFSGVDVFFVVSGYLMTMIIWKRLESSQFSLIAFYLARVRRIVPALAVLCLALLLVGTLWLDPVSYADLGSETTAALLFYSNIVFWLQSGDFDAASETKMLLHTWSLSVEWQFYIVYPIALMLLHRYGRRYAAPIVLAAAALSFVLAVYMSTRRPGLDFYLLPTRAWEMAAGGLVYFFGLRNQVPDRFRSILFVVGAVIVCGTAIFIEADVPWPGLATFPVVFGTALIIAAGFQAKWIHEFPPIKIIGRWSYSIYLWHWPVMVFLAPMGLSSRLTPWVLLPIVLVLAGLSYTFIEQAGLNRLDARHVWSSVIGAGVFALCILGATGVSETGGLPGRFGGNASRVATISQAVNDWTFPSSCGGLTRWGTLKSCTLGHGKRRIRVLGDSFAEQLYPYFERLTASDPSISIEFATLGGCPPLPGMNLTAPGTSCLPFNQLNFQTTLAGHYDVVVVASMWSRYFEIDPNAKGRAGMPICFETATACTKPRDEADRSEGLKASFAGLSDFSKSLKSDGTKVVLIGPTPFPARDAPEYPRELIWREFFKRNTADLEAIDLADFKARDGFIETYLTEAAAQSGATLFDPTTVLCHEGRCPVLDSHHLPLYRDSAHLRSSYVASMSFGALTDTILGHPISGELQSTDRFKF